LLPVICYDGGVLARSMLGAYVVIVSREDGVTHLRLEAVVKMFFLNVNRTETNVHSQMSLQEMHHQEFTSLLRMLGLLQQQRTNYTKQHTFYEVYRGFP